MTGKTKLEKFVQLRPIYKLKKQFQFVHVWLAVALHGKRLFDKLFMALSLKLFSDAARCFRRKLIDVVQD